MGKGSAGVLKKESKKQRMVEIGGRTAIRSSERRRLSCRAAPNARGRRLSAEVKQRPRRKTDVWGTRPLFFEATFHFVLFFFCRSKSPFFKSSACCLHFLSSLQSLARS